MAVPRTPHILPIALIGAAGTSSIALFDAVHHGVTGRYSAFSDEYGQTATMMAGSAVHGLTYATFVWVLLAAAPEIDAGNRAWRWVRRGLVAVFVTLAALFLGGLPLEGSLGPVQAALGVVGGSAFLLMFLLAFALGVTLVRRADQRPAAVLLLAVLPAIGLAFALQALGTDFAHPAYAETAVHFGVALLALPLARRSAALAEPQADPVVVR